MTYWSPNMERTRTYTWQDPILGASRAKTLSGMEYLQAMDRDEIPLPPFLDTLGMGKPLLEKGKVAFPFEPKEYHYNPVGCVHGGVITAVLDSAMGCTVHSLLPAGTGYSTLELKVNFVGMVTLKNKGLLAIGRVIHLGKSTALVEADLKDDEGKVYAHATSTCMIFKSHP